MTAHRRGPRFQKTSKYILKIIFYFSFYNSSTLQNARLMFYYFLFVRLSGHKGKKYVFCVNFALFMKVCDTGAWLCRENDDVYLLHFLKIDCKPNESQSVKALTVSLFCSLFFI